MTELYDLDFVHEKVHRYIERDAVLNNQFADLYQRQAALESKLDTKALTELQTSRVEYTEFLMLQSFLAGIAYTKQFYKTESLMARVSKITI